MNSSTEIFAEKEKSPTARFQFVVPFTDKHNPIVIPSQFANWRGNLLGNLGF